MVRVHPLRSVQASQSDAWARPEARVAQRERPIALRLDALEPRTQIGSSRPPFMGQHKLETRHVGLTCTEEYLR